ncbi:Lanosterol 14-alpha-demethylase, partial [Spiromyces aspiralis]
AHAELERIFSKVIEARRKQPHHQLVDMLDVFMTTTYKSGESISDLQATNLCIVLLMAGQHTSAATTTWALLNLAKQHDILDSAYVEMKHVMGDDLPDVEYEDLKKLETLDDIVRETLRIHPPLLQIMRKVIKPIAIPGTSYILPAGNYLVASPMVSATDKAHFFNPEAFIPSRWRQKQNAADAENDDDKSNIIDYGFGDMNT